MTDITPVIKTGHQFIQGYGYNGFRIAGENYSGSVIVSQLQTRYWNVTSLHGLNVENLIKILAEFSELEIVLLGTGETMVPPVENLKNQLKNVGIGLEFMNTGAACRTFNVLAAEGRSVAAALIAV